MCVLHIWGLNSQNTRNITIGNNKKPRLAIACGFPSLLNSNTISNLITEVVGTLWKLQTETVLDLSTAPKLNLNIQKSLRLRISSSASAMQTFCAVHRKLHRFKQRKKVCTKGIENWYFEGKPVSYTCSMIHKRVPVPADKTFAQWLGFLVIDMCRSKLSGNFSPCQRELVRQYNTGHQHFMHRTNAPRLNQQNIPRRILTPFIESITTDVLHRLSHSARSNYYVGQYRLDCQQPPVTK